MYSLLATVASGDSRADVPIPSSLDALSSGDLSCSQDYMDIITYAFLVGVVMDIFVPFFGAVRQLHSVNFPFFRSTVTTATHFIWNGIACVLVIMSRMK